MSNILVFSIMKIFFRRTGLIFLFLFLSFSNAESNNLPDNHHAIINQAELLYEKGDYYSAFNLLSNHKKNLLKSNDNLNLIAETDEWLGEIYFVMEDLNEAFKYFTYSLNSKKKVFPADDEEIAFSLSNIGRYYSEAQNYDSASIYLQQSLQIISNLKQIIDTIKYAKILNEVAYSTKSSGDKSGNEYFYRYNKARSYYFQALELIRKKYKQPSYYEALILHNIGNTYNDNVRDKKNKLFIQYKDSANKYYNLSISINNRISGNKNPRSAMTMFVKGLLLYYAYGVDSLAGSLKNYNHSIQELIGNAQSDDPFQIPNTTKCFYPYQLIQVVQWKIRAFEKLYTKTHDEKYFDALYSHSEYAILLWDQIIKNFQSLDFSHILSLYSNVPFQSAISSNYKLFLITGKDEFKIKAFELTEKSKYAVLLRNVFACKTELNNEIGTISLNEVKNKLTDETAVIEYYADDGNGIYVFIITKTMTKLLKVNSPEDIRESIQKFRNAILDRDEAKTNRLSWEIYKELFSTVKLSLDSGIKRLIIIPHSYISLIPFEALNTVNSDKPDWLINKYCISYSLSSSLLFNNVSEKLNNGNLVSIAPEFNRMASLPFCKRMSEQIADEWNGKIFDPVKESSIAFLKNQSNTAILNFATHSKTNLNNPLSSCIYFSDIDSLMLEDLYSLKFNANLAVLASCETGFGKIVEGEGVIDFARGFAYAGCRSTITTLWKVDDKITAEILSKFFQYLEKGLEKNTALQNSKRDYLTNCKTSELASPFYWSGIVLTGNTSPVIFKNRINYTNYYLFAILVLLFSGLWFYKRLKK